MMTSAAQSALRRGALPLLFFFLFPTICALTSTLPFGSSVIEQYTKNVRFCIICNYVNKIIPAVQSRCTRFRWVSWLAIPPYKGG